MKRLVALVAVALILSGCTVTIPSIGFSGFAIFGGQRELDQGHLVIPEWGGISDGHGGVYRDGCLPRHDCPVWLAGHRTTHGSIFNRLPDVEVGAIVEVQVGDEVTTYEITDRRIVGQYFPAAEMVGDIILQTSWPNNRRLLLFGTEIARR